MSTVPSSRMYDDMRGRITLTLFLLLLTSVHALLSPGTVP